MEQNSGYLVINRRARESVVIESPCGKFKVEILVDKCSSNRTRLLFKADRSVKIRRKELPKLDEEKLTDSFKT